MSKELLKKIYQTYRLFIFPIAVIISCLILITLIIFPQTMALINNFQSENELQSKFKIMDAKAQTLEGVDGSELNQKLAVALNVYPSDYDFSSVVGTLQEVVGRFGFTVVSLQIGKSASPSGSSNSSFNIKLELVGVKTLLNSLVSGIENSPRIMKVTNIEVSSVNADNANVSLNVEAYYRTMPQTFGSVDSPLPVLSDKEEAILSTLARVSSRKTSTVSTPKGKSNPFE